MNAAKKIRRFIEEGHDPQQMQVLKELATALEMGRSLACSTISTCATSTSPSTC